MIKQVNIKKKYINGNVSYKNIYLLTQKIYIYFISIYNCKFQAELHLPYQKEIRYMGELVTS